MTDPVEVVGVAERLAPYALSLDGEEPEPDLVSEHDAIDDLIERANLLLAVMPPHQRRETIEKLVAPNDPERGRRALDALLEGGRVQVDFSGHLHRVG